MADNKIKLLEKKLWEAADQLRANSGISAHEYMSPVLGLIFLRFATLRFNHYRKEIEDEYNRLKGGRNERSIEDIAVDKCGYYLPKESSFDYLLNLSKNDNIILAIRHAMQALEESREELKNCLPDLEYENLVPKNSYGKSDQSVAFDLLKIIAEIPPDISGDLFGLVYEYFLGKFASSEGTHGGEYYTPTSVVRLMVEMIEPYNGKILDPACGSGGMFVQSAKFVREHNKAKTSSQDLKVYGVELKPTTVKIARMNMFLNGLRSEIYQGSSYEIDPFNSYHNFDYVMANPPFNVDDVNMETVKDQQRFNEYGLPHNKSKKSGKNGQKETVPNANYLWINLFAASLNEHGRAALVMANSATDSGKDKGLEIREKLVKSGLICGMLSLPGKMFYNVTVPATLWFFDRGRANPDDVKVLFINGQNVFHQIDRAHREYTEEQIQNLACIRHLYQGDKTFYDNLINKYEGEIAERKGNLEVAEKEYKAISNEVEGLKKVPSTLNRKLKEAQSNLDNTNEALKYMLTQREWLVSRFPDGKYVDVTGLCKVATLDDIAEQGYSLNPGRYVGIVIEDDGLTREEFLSEVKQRNDELNELNKKADELMKLINKDMEEILK